MVFSNTTEPFVSITGTRSIRHDPESLRGLRCRARNGRRTAPDAGGLGENRWNIGAHVDSIRRAAERHARAGETIIAARDAGELRVEIGVEIIPRRVARGVSSAQQVG